MGIYGELIREARIANGLELREFAELINMKPSRFIEIQQHPELGTDAELQLIVDGLRNARESKAGEFLSVLDARDQKVCRICRGPAEVRKIGREVDSFVYNYGREHAHKSCLRAVGITE